MSQEEDIKFHGYINVFREKLQKLCKQIKKYRKEGKISKQHTRQLIEEAKCLRKLLKKVDEGTSE